MTILIRKYYNQAIAFDHRRHWLQKEKQKRELRLESQRQSQNQERPNLNQNLKERKSPSADTQLAFLEEQKQSKKFLVEVKSHQVK